MCECCSAEAIDIGEVVPGWLLVRATRRGLRMHPGDYGLVRSNDPDFIFRMPPEPDPARGLSDEEYDRNPQIHKDWMAWHSRFALEYEPELITDPMTGYALVKACLEAGYDPDEHGTRIVFWLVDRMARTLENAKT